MGQEKVGCSLKWATCSHACSNQKATRRDDIRGKVGGTRRETQYVWEAGGIKGLGNVENERGSLLTEDGQKRQVKEEHWQAESASLTCSASCTQSPSKTKHTRESRWDSWQNYAIQSIVVILTVLSAEYWVLTGDQPATGRRGWAMGSSDPSHHQQDHNCQTRNG